MRKVTLETKKAFDEGRRLLMGNTQVVSSLDVTSLYLFGHEIVRKDYEGLKIRTAGYNTKTTVERLKAFVKIRISKGCIIVNEKFEWDGEWLNLTQYEQYNNLRSL